MKHALPTRLSLYYLVIIVVVIVLGTLASLYTYKQVARNTQDTLLKNVVSIASVFELADILTLTGSDADLTNPDYISLKAKLEKIPEVNDDITFVYIWGYRDGNPYFMMDSEPADSEDYSPPGQVYDEATELDHDLFLKNLPPSVEISTDRWGTWLSGLAPIVDESTGEVAAVLGVDMLADKYYRNIYVYTSIPVITTLFVLFLILTGYLLQKREGEFIAFKSELVSIASHEIRSPLTGISWLITTLLKSADNLNDRQREDINIIKTKSEGLLATINALLDSAAVDRVDKNKLEKTTFNARKLFEDIERNYHLNLEEKNVRLDIDHTVTPEVSISGDRERIGRMFTNIVSNAIKYSNSGGAITISKKWGEKTVIFSIKDEGIGIPKDDQGKVFRGFFRAENATKATKNGTGLGLYYVKQIALLHGGRVWYESEEGKGTTFYIELPKA